MSLGSAAPRSSIEDHQAFSASYRPRLYGRRSGPCLARDLDELEELLTAALARMTDPSPRPVRRWPTGVEETSCGLCYETAA